LGGVARLTGRTSHSVVVEFDAEFKIAVCPARSDKRSALSPVGLSGYVVIGDELEPEIFKYAAGVGKQLWVVTSFDCDQISEV
jgi:hypothetical protein